VRTLCKRLAAKAGIEKRVHPHGLRHGWALAQVQSGTSLNAIQQLLGHRSLHPIAREESPMQMEHRRESEDLVGFEHTAAMRTRPRGSPGERD
jgi:integrase